MAVNPKWHGWVYASVADHLHTAALAADLPLVVDFLDKQDDAWKAATRKVQVTITGPRTRELSRKFFRVHVDVFVRVTSDRAPSGDTDYTHINKVGAIDSALQECILCRTYGEVLVEDIGILIPRSAENDETKPEHLQPAEKDTQIHSTIEARLIGFFKEK